MNIDHTIKGTGNQDLDYAKLNAAVADLIPKGGGYLGIDGPVRLKGKLKHGMAAISLVGVSRDAELLYTDPASLPYWGDFYDPLKDPAAVSYSGNGAYAYDFESPNLALVPGDIVQLWSDDNLSDSPPHLSFQRGLEVHQVKEVRGTRVLLDDFIRYSYTTNPKLAKLQTINNVRVADLKLTYIGTGENPRCLDFRKVKGLRVENVTIGPKGPGHILVSSFMDAWLDGVNSEGHSNYDLSHGYQVIFCAGTGFHYTDSIIKGSRHAFTTSGISQGASMPGGPVNVRWGTARNGKIVNIFAQHNGRPTSGLAVFDCHAESWGLEFINCTAIVPSDQRNVGFNLRAPGCKLLDCIVRGGGNVRAITINASDCSVLGGGIYNCWQGIHIATMSGHIPRNTHLAHIEFDGVYGVPIVGEMFDGLTIDHNTILHSGYYGTSGYPKALVWLKQGRDAKIYLNTMPKTTGYPMPSNPTPSNDFSIKVEQLFQGPIDVSGNVLRGYGTGNPGILGAAGQNFTD